jgi:regulator of RNase E activity RraB
MSEEWDFYFATVNENVASLFVDLGIREQAPDPSKPWLLWVWLQFQNPREDGLSSSEESETLDAIEDSLLESVESALGGSLVGRITTEGRREFYFYSPTDAGLDEAVATAMTPFPVYEFECGTHSDPEWEHYVGLLYPSPHDWQCMKNRHVLQELRENGDSLELQRPVFHWAYFPSEESRASFATAVTERGFELDELSEQDDPEADPDLPFGISFERVDHVDWDSINQVTIELYDLAEANGGDYDGWETSVESDIEESQPE